MQVTNQNKGQYQKNVFYKYVAAQQHVVCFFGYVKGRETTGDITSISKMSNEFLTMYKLDIEPENLKRSYINFCKVFKEFLKQIK